MSFLERKGFRPQHQERRRRLGRTAGIFLAATTVITGTGVLVADKIINSDINAATNLNTGLTTNLQSLSQEDCPLVDESVLQVVRTIFSTKDPNELKAVSPVTPNKYDKYVRLQAERFGVSLHDPNPAYDKLVQAQTVDDVLGSFNEFLSGFSYTATIPDQKDEYDELTRVDMLSPEDLDPTKFAVGTYAAILALQYLPIEVANLAGDIELRFVKSIQPDEKGNSTTIGLATSYPKRIYVDMNAFYFGNDFIIPHEIGHHIDANTCGVEGSSIDSQYSGLNPSDFEYLGDNYVTVTNQQVEDFVANAYGMDKLVEDKATLMQENLTEAEGFGDMAPVLRSKFELIISRIEQHAPRYAGYLRAISRKHDK